ncbi:MAG: hypothetical protein IPI69_03250 [Bacteroidales bacterium]|nr:hypothetical protein [Bacteroidales bacterium]
MYKNTPFRVLYDSIQNQTVGLPVSIRILSSDSYKLDIDGDPKFSKTLAFGERFNEMGFDFTIVRNSDLFRLIPGLQQVLFLLYKPCITCKPVPEKAQRYTI